MPATSPRGSGRRRSTAERRRRAPTSSRSARFRRGEFAKFRGPRFRTLSQPTAWIGPPTAFWRGTRFCQSIFSNSPGRQLSLNQGASGPWEPRIVVPTLHGTVSVQFASFAPRRPEYKSIAFSISLKRRRQSDVSHVALPLNLGIFPSRPRRNTGNHVLSSLRLTLFINWRIFVAYVIGHGRSGLGEFSCPAIRSPELTLFRPADSGGTIGLNGWHSRREAGTAGLSVGHAHRLAAALPVVA
jgi:hypothetical protein